MKTKIYRAHGKRWTLPIRLGFEMVSGFYRSTAMPYTILGFRAPKQGEHYVSGAKPKAYKAPNDLTTEFLIVKPIID